MYKKPFGIHPDGFFCGKKITFVISYSVVFYTLIYIFDNIYCLAFYILELTEVYW